MSKRGKKSPKFKNMLRTYPRLRKGEELFTLDTAQNIVVVICFSANARQGNITYMCGLALQTMQKLKEYVIPCLLLFLFYWGASNYGIVFSRFCFGVSFVFVECFVKRLGRSYGNIRDCFKRSLPLTSEAN